MRIGNFVIFEWVPVDKALSLRKAVEEADSFLQKYNKTTLHTFSQRIKSVEHDINRLYDTHRNEIKSIDQLLEGCQSLDKRLRELEAKVQ